MLYCVDKHAPNSYTNILYISHSTTDGIKKTTYQAPGSKILS